MAEQILSGGRKLILQTNWSYVTFLRQRQGWGFRIPWTWSGKEKTCKQGSLPYCPKPRGKLVLIDFDLFYSWEKDFPTYWCSSTIWSEDGSPHLLVQNWGDIGLDKDGGVEKWFCSGCILKAKPPGFSNGLPTECTRGTRMTHYLVTYWGWEDCGRGRFRNRLTVWSTVWNVNWKYFVNA